MLAWHYLHMREDTTALREKGGVTIFVSYFLCSSGSEVGGDLRIIGKIDISSYIMDKNLLYSTTTFVCFHLCLHWQCYLLLCELGEDVIQIILRDS
jgi:hypothetical protein